MGCPNGYKNAELEGDDICGNPNISVLDNEAFKECKACAAGEVCEEDSDKCTDRQIHNTALDVCINCST